jgi:alanine dehydrogenase
MMDIGVPTEQQMNEYRVGLTPQGVRLLAQAGHRCYVEQGAGEGAGFNDGDYERAGARIVYGSSEVWERADLILKVQSPTPDELDLARDGQLICGFWHLAAHPRSMVEALVQKKISVVAYEMIEADDGRLPVLHPLSEIAGRMAPQIAARWLQNDGGGSGVLISGLPGVPPIDVVVLGAGTVGINAARAFYGLGARVFVLDQQLEKLQRLDEQYSQNIATMVAHDFNIARVVQFAHVVVGAVLVPGERCPVLITREMLRTMRPRSVILDFSIDQGGCVETSRPTTHQDPVYIEEDVIHFCVPNVSGVVARTATHAYLNAAWPFIEQVANEGIEIAMQHNPSLRRGVAVQGGKVLNPSLARLIMESV